MAEAPATQQRKAPLAGLTVLEMAGIGPVPLAALMLADLGAEIVRIERAGPSLPFLELPAEYDISRHGRSNLTIDLKQPEGIDVAARLADRADILLEGFRPGVMERLGLGPDVLCTRNPRLVYGRMTGFGQDGPLARTAGHDLTYLAWTGLLHAIGHAEDRPVPPLNLVADYGGGTMFLIMGVLAALIERGRSGLGQVVDAAMVDGASMLALPTFAYLASGLWQDRRGANLLDSGTPFYDTYETADAKHVAVACLEPQFFAEFCRLLPLDPSFADAQYDRHRWQDMRRAIAARIAQQSRDEWTAVFAGSDACVAPVLSLKEAPGSPLAEARAMHRIGGAFQRPMPAPRFSHSVVEPADAVQATSAQETLLRFGFQPDEISTLVERKICRQ